jgi:hypothetical protein
VAICQDNRGLSVGKGSELGKLECVLKKLDDMLAFISKRGRLVKLVIAVIAAALLSGIMLANVRSIYQTSSTIFSVGTFKAIGLGVYWDSGFTNRTTEINWGTLELGTQKSYTIYIRNEGTIPLTLSTSTSNWNPSTASNHLTLSWSYSGKINAGEIVPVMLTLSISPSITETSFFSFDITAVGSE